VSPTLYEDRFGHARGHGAPCVGPFVVEGLIARSKIDNQPRAGQQRRVKLASERGVGRVIRGDHGNPAGADYCPPMLVSMPRSVVVDMTRPSLPTGLEPLDVSELDEHDFTFRERHTQTVPHTVLLGRPPAKGDLALLGIVKYRYRR
jgi:hypothetical protein